MTSLTINSLGQKYNWNSQELMTLASYEAFFGSVKLSNIACAASRVAVELESYDDWWNNS